MEEGGDGRIRKCGDERTQRLSGFKKESAAFSLYMMTVPSTKSLIKTIGEKIRCLFFIVNENNVLCYMKGNGLAKLVP